MLRVATWHVELWRAGPGLLLQDIEKGDPQVAAIAATLTQIQPDIVLLTDIDWDYGGVAARALADLVGGYTHVLALKPNSGVQTGLDLDGDERLGGPGDALGYGSFTGQGGVALLSRYPIALTADYTGALWADQPEALLYDGMPPEEAALLTLFSTGAWEVEVAGLTLLAFAASTPVFDGPEDRNGRRNHDQLAFLLRRLETIDAPLVALGNTNQDPVDGEGIKAPLHALLDHPRLQDPMPRSAGGAAVANPDHRGEPALDTADWDEPTPGNLRVSYVLPDAGLDVLGSGVIWVAPETRYGEGLRHRLVWVDLEHTP